MSTLNGNNNATESEQQPESGSQADSGKHPPPLTTVIEVHNGVTAASSESYVRESSGSSSPNVGKHCNETETKKIDPKVLHRVKLVCLFVAIVIVWVLVSIPIVLFHIPVGIMELNGSGELQPTTILAVDTESNQSVSCSCRKGFYCRNGSNLCYPECGSWKQFSDTTSTISDVFVILSAVIGTLGSVTVVIIAVIKRKKTFVFPLVFLVYQTIIYLVLVVIILITCMDRVTLYCGSQDLLESIETPTPYCTISGIIISYGLFQYGLWGVFRIVAMYWKLQFPLHYRQFNTTGRIKYIHLAAVILGLVFALLPVITPIADHAVKKSSSENSTLLGIGFTMTRVPPIVCTISNANIAYYSLAFPLNLILFVDMTLLLLVLWIIHKHQGLFKERITLSTSNKSKWFKISTAERKVLIVVTYYVFITDISLLSLSLGARNSSEIINRVGEHFLCELTHPSEPCPRSFEELQYPYLTEIGFVLFSLFPFTVLNVLINFRELLVKIKKSTSSAVPKMMATSASS